MIKKILPVVFVLLIFGFNQVKAQLSFPRGNVLDTVTNALPAYEETKILFHTGAYKSTDYLFEKISDSIDTAWLVTACFNGDCRNELETNGKFISDYGYNDTTCFIAFHVFSNDKNGKCKIVYRVYNSKDISDAAILEFNVTYRSTTSIINQKNKNTGFVFYPNPAKNSVKIQLPNSSAFNLQIIDLQGKTLLNEHYTNSAWAVINTANLPAGVYMLQLQNSTYTGREKLIIY